jgi:acetyl-CoA carboxylase carboxyltransferase component
MTSFVKLIGRPAAFARHVSTTAFEKNMKIFEKFKAMMSEAELSMQNESSNPQKLNTWDRLKLLRDKDSFQLIISPLAGYFSPYGKVVNAGMVIAITKVGGRVAMVTLNDWMHKGGTVFPITLKKQLRAQEISRKNHIPSIYVVDSGGAFLPLQVGAVWHNVAYLSLLPEKMADEGLTKHRHSILRKVVRMSMN